MPTPVLMPQMGESIAEGTIVRWMKKVGESVDRDEPLFEISTDKVDAEIPSPAAGVLAEIAVTEGQTVPVNSIVATIRSDGEATTERTTTAAAAPAAAAPRAESAPSTQEVSGRKAASASTQAQGDGASGRDHDAGTTPSAPTTTSAASAGTPGAAAEEAPRQRSSPLVRRIAKE